MEAIVSLALLGLLLAMPLHENKPNLANLHAFKKENDLLLLWAKQPELNEAQMLQDFKFAFPGKSGLIVFGGKELAIGKQGGKSVSSKAVFFDKHLKKREMRLTVFK